MPEDPLEAFERGFKPCVCTLGELSPEEVSAPDSSAQE